MAATKKKAPVKKAVVKKTSVKAAPAKKTTVKNTTSKKVATKKQPEVHSFRIANDRQPFTEFRITRQTIYWVILIAFIIFAQLWILKLQIEVATLLDAQQTRLQDF